MMTVWAIVLAVFSILVSFIAAGMAGYAIIVTIGLRNSTHRIQWIPASPEMKSGEDLAEEFAEHMYGELPKKKQIKE